MKPCEPQDVTAASTLRASKITTQLPHVIVVKVAAREQGWGRGRGEEQSVYRIRVYIGSERLWVGETCTYLDLYFQIACVIYLHLPVTQKTVKVITQYMHDKEYT